MNFVLPESLEKTLSPEQARLDFAAGIFSGGRVTLGAAAEVAGLSVPEFQRELGRRRIAVHYGPDDLAYDLNAAAELARA